MKILKFISPVLVLSAVASSAFAHNASGHHQHSAPAHNSSNTSYFGFDFGLGYGAYGSHIVKSGDFSGDTADFDFSKTSSGNASINYGYYVSDAFRVDLSLNNHQYRERWYTTSTTSGTNAMTVNAMAEASIVDLLLSGYYDFNVNEIWTPYVGVGFGYGSGHYKQYFNHTVINLTTAANNDLYSDLGRVNKGSFTYQGAVGVMFKMGDSSHLNLGYKYHCGTVKTLEATSADNASVYDYKFKFHPGSHIVTLGTTYHF